MSLDFVSIVSQEEEEVQILVDVSDVEIGEYVFAINDIFNFFGTSHVYN